MVSFSVLDIGEGGGLAAYQLSKRQSLSVPATLSTTRTGLKKKFVYLIVTSSVSSTTQSLPGVVFIHIFNLPFLSAGQYQLYFQWPCDQHEATEKQFLAYRLFAFILLRQEPLITGSP